MRSGRKHFTISNIDQVAGTTVYEERRAQSVKILKTTDLRRDKIKDVISHIDAKLKTLDEEKSDLKQFLVYDKKSRAITYAIHSLTYDQTCKKVRSTYA